MSCDLSGFTQLDFSQSQTFKTAVNTFNRIQAFDSNVSTLKHIGAINQYYYNFKDYTEKNNYIQGQLLLRQSYPTQSTIWTSVQRN
uniref:Uncharacterized protein n=1 Tax=viral metagenome TaxID=1070528 RepID=A0A6C0BBQ2_9ZZZZ